MSSCGVFSFRSLGYGKGEGAAQELGGARVRTPTHTRVHTCMHASSAHQTVYERPQTPTSDSLGATFSEEPKETGIPRGRRGRFNPPKGRVVKNGNVLQQEQYFSKENLSPTTVVVPNLVIVLGIVIRNKGKGDRLPFSCSRSLSVPPARMGNR